MSHKSVESKAIPWPQVMKHIKEAGRSGISWHELAKKLKVERNDEGLRRTIEEVLIPSGRINKAIGASNGMICVMLTVERKKD